MKTNTIIIEKMVNGGYGLARKKDGQVLLLRNALPKEHLQYTITEKRKGTLFGCAQTILEPHQARISPPCPYFGECGGCDLQHASYDLQLEIKRAVLAELFSGVSESIQPLIPSPRQFGYRQRIRLHTRNGKFGFLRFRSTEIIPIERCLLAHPHINSVLERVLPQEAFAKLCRISDEVEFLFNPADEQIRLLFHLQRKPRSTDCKTAEKLTTNTKLLASVYFTGETFAQIGPLSGNISTETSRLLSQTIQTPGSHELTTLSWEVGGFCQVNLEQNSKLIECVGGNCDSEGEHLLDLYCGMGNFSIPLAHKFATIIGVEGQGASIRCARHNSSEANLSNIEYIKGAIHKVCQKLIAEGKIFETTIIDPPRQGIAGLPEMLTLLTTRKLIYISCDPATLARDTRNLIRNDFHLTHIQPFDMFPQTHHIETVVIFEKN